MVLNAKFHLFQELTNLFTAMIALDKTNHKIRIAQDIPEMIEAQDIPEMIEAQDHPTEENQVETILDLENQKVINF